MLASLTMSWALIEILTEAVAQARCAVSSICALSPLKSDNRLINEM
jgi:hypothetical protein